MNIYVFSSTAVCEYFVNGHQTWLNETHVLRTVLTNKAYYVYFLYYVLSLSSVNHSRV